MMRATNEIIANIRKLLEELEGMTDNNSSRSSKRSANKTSAVIPKGALGAIQMITEEGFFDTPKEISAVLERLKEIGHYHKPTAIAMNLLNLTKRRTLNRFKNKENKNWEYVIRK